MEMTDRIPVVNLISKTQADWSAFLNLANQIRNEPLNADLDRQGVLLRSDRAFLMAASKFVFDDMEPIDFLFPLVEYCFAGSCYTADIHEAVNSCDLLLNVHNHYAGRCVFILSGNLQQWIFAFRRHLTERNHVIFNPYIIYLYNAIYTIINQRLELPLGTKVYNKVKGYPDLFLLEM